MSDIVERKYEPMPMTADVLRRLREIEHRVRSVAGEMVNAQSYQLIGDANYLTDLRHSIEEMIDRLRAPPTEAEVEGVAKAYYAKTIEIVAILRPGAPFMSWEELPEEQRRIALAGGRAALSAFLAMRK